MRTKICGIRNMEDAETALRAGANALGFLVGITHLAEDKLDKESARAIIEKLPPFVSSVLVTHWTDPGEIVDLARYLCVNTVQLHDYLPPAAVAEVRAQLTDCKLIKTIHVREQNEAMRLLRLFEPVCDAVLLDSRTKDRLGGTGMIHDWNISAAIVRQSAVPVILAGGLSAQNVYDAVLRTRPYGVDVNSGVERDGYKDYDQCLRFIEEAKLAERRGA